MEEQQKTNNMFDDMANTNDESMPEQPQGQKDTTDDVFDYNELSDTPGKKYDRANLDGQTVTIINAVIEKPSDTDEWIKPISGNNPYKKYGLKVEYDTPNNDREYFSGLKGFKQDDGSVSKPSMYLQGKNQVAQLFKLYKAHVMNTKDVSEKDFDENYGLKKFMAFLNTNPKVELSYEEVEFNNRITHKNLVKRFV